MPQRHNYRSLSADTTVFPLPNIGFGIGPGEVEARAIQLLTFCLAHLQRNVPHERVVQITRAYAAVAGSETLLWTPTCHIRVTNDRARGQCQMSEELGQSDCSVVKFSQVFESVIFQPASTAPTRFSSVNHHLVRAALARVSLLRSSSIIASEHYCSGRKVRPGALLPLVDEP